LRLSRSPKNRRVTMADYPYEGETMLGATTWHVAVHVGGQEDKPRRPPGGALTPHLDGRQIADGGTPIALDRDAGKRKAGRSWEGISGHLA
jgi:hypothetical protein